MESILELINSQLQNEQHARIVFVVLTAVAALAFAFSVVFLITTLTAPFRNRVQALTRATTPHSSSREEVNHLLSSLDPVTKHFMPKKQGAIQHIRLKLMHAGFRSDAAVKNFYALKVFLCILAFFTALYVIRYFPEVNARETMLYALGSAFIGLMLPNYVLEKLANRRMTAIHRSFPDMLDMLVVCVESGLGLNAALQRVASELDVSHPELAGEISLVNSEIRAGVNRIDALKAMAERTGVEDIRGLVALLDQSVRFGGSIADTLRVYSEEFRDKRMQKAEEAAAKIGTKLIFPLTFCLWPGFFLVAVGPAVLKVLEVFGR